jgi:trk system potassium uptake protein TrkA
VIGLGRFGTALARALTDDGAEVIGIDRNPSRVEALRDEIALAVRLDGTVEEALRAQDVDHVDAAIVAIGEVFEASALSVATLKTMGVKRVLVRAMTEVQAAILTKIGADVIIRPELEAAYRWAHRLAMPDLKQYVELGEGHSLVYLVAPAAFHDHTLAELQLRARYGVNLIAITRTEPITGPDGDTTERRQVYMAMANTKILAGDVLALVGADDRLAALPRD